MVTAIAGVQKAADNLDALVFMVLVDANVPSEKMRDYLYRDRTKLSVYALATYGLALHNEHQADKQLAPLQGARAEI